MNQGKLEQKKIAIIAADGFEQSELIAPREALRKAGAEVEVVSPRPGAIQGFEHFDRGESVSVDCKLDDADPSDYDALLIPGGLFNPDQLRRSEAALAFTRSFFAAGKPVAAICHGPWVLVDAGMVEDRTLTSWPAIRTDIENAGGRWVDEEVVVDRGLVTSRSPDDLEAFCAKLIEEVGEGRHEGQRAAAVS